MQFSGKARNAKTNSLDFGSDQNRLDTVRYQGNFNFC